MPSRNELPHGSPRDWLRRARSSCAYARISNPEEVCWEEPCFQAQQAAEKAIKGLMLHFDVRFPYVHDLGLLLDEFEKGGITIPDDVRECVDLTPYAFQTRYPGDYEPVTEEDYHRAIEQANAVVDWVSRIIESDSGPLNEQINR